MPVISKFYGIVIRLLKSPSYEACFQANYGEHELVVGIWPLKIVGGNAPQRVKQLVLEWAAKHQQELLSSWHCCVDGLQPLQVKPLD